MKIFEPKKYPNLLNEINLTSKEIVHIIKNYNLSFLPNKNQAVEWNMELPMFVSAFYDYIMKENNIPNQLEYYNNYLAINETFFNDKAFNKYTVLAIKARAFRAYPSFIRDIHFAKYISERFRKSEVIYNQELDIEEGIDLMIINNEHYFAINLFTKTTRAFRGRYNKLNRHVDFTNVNYMDVPVDFKGSMKCGNFLLYGKREMNLIIEEMKKYLN